MTDRARLRVSPPNQTAPVRSSPRPSISSLVRGYRRDPGELAGRIPPVGIPATTTGGKEERLRQGCSPKWKPRTNTTTQRSDKQ
jgi:hypothetical protein